MPSQSSNPGSLAILKRDRRLLILSPLSVLVFATLKIQFTSRWSIEPRRWHQGGDDGCEFSYETSSSSTVIPIAPPSSRPSIWPRVRIPVVRPVPDSSNNESLASRAPLTAVTGQYRHPSSRSNPFLNLTGPPKSIRGQTRVPEKVSLPWLRRSSVVV